MKRDKGKQLKTFFKNVEIEDEGSEHFKKWYEEVQEDPKHSKPVSEQELIELKEEAQKCLDIEVSNYNKKNHKSNSSNSWIKTVMTKGTVSDKIAAHVVSIQENPICNLSILRNLVGLVKVAKKKECMAAIDALTDLFISDLLPVSNLRHFDQRPLSELETMTSGNGITRRKILSAWYFEDQLKDLYAAFTNALNAVVHDSVENNKEKGVGAMYKLLAGNSEQEKTLLANLVNKLGDPSPKVTSKVIYCLSQLLLSKPKKQLLVLNEVERLLFRPNISMRAQYYGLCFLSQFYLNHKANDVATKLVQVYFAFFKSCIKKGEVDSRMMSALLMGVNRAYPYAKLEPTQLTEHIDTLYRVVHLANFSVSLHALNFLFQVSSGEENVADRFYTALYKKLLDVRLTTTTHQAMLLSLIYKALMKDKAIGRVKVFFKRLLQVSLNSQPNFACGILFILSQILKKKRGTQALRLIGNPEIKIEESEDIPEIKTEVEDCEDFKDTNSKEMNGYKLDVQLNVKIEDISKEIESEDLEPNVESLNSEIKAEKQYNPLCRNPLYCGGESCVYTELAELKKHFHPTVALYAQSLLKGEVIKYSGDPLKDFTLIRFLDRFVFKNPKKASSNGQGAHPAFGARKLYKPSGIRSLPVTSGAYLNENQKNIPVDELFMHTYLQRRYQSEKVIKKEDEDSDVESVQSEEFEDMLAKMAGLKEDGDDLDYMNDIGENLKNRKQANKKHSEEDDTDDEDQAEENDDEDSDDDDVEDIEFNDENEEELGDMKLGMKTLDELSEDEFSDDDLNDDDLDESDGSESDNEEFQHTNKNKKGTKRKGSDINSLFASADEFASLLDEEGVSKIAPGKSSTLINKDHANPKQLTWEEKRNNWIRGFNKMVGKKQKFSHKSSKSSKKFKNVSNKKKTFH